MEYLHYDRESVFVCSVQPTVPCLIDKGLDAIATNQEAVIIVSEGIAIAFIFWGLGRGISEVVAVAVLKMKR